MKSFIMACVVAVVIAVIGVVALNSIPGSGREGLQHPNAVSLGARKLRRIRYPISAA